MAIMFLNVSSVSRGRGGSAVSKAAYIARDRLPDARAGVIRDYRRVPGLEHSEILLPAGSADADWARNRETLWNRAEAAERQRNARVAREYTVALPHELSSDARRALARDFAQHLANRYGTAVDLAVHGPTPHGDPRNHHAHLLATTREVGAEGFGAKAEIELSSSRRRELGLQHVAHELRALRAQWAELANERLREANIAVRLEPRSRATLDRAHTVQPEAPRHAPDVAPPAPALAPSAPSEPRVAATRPEERVLTPESAQQRAVEQWLAYRAGQGADPARRAERDRTRERGLDAGLEP